MVGGGGGGEEGIFGGGGGGGGTCSQKQKGPHGKSEETTPETGRIKCEFMKKMFTNTRLRGQGV